MAQKLSIEFSSGQQPVYAPGDKVTGNVILENQSSSPVEGSIKLRFRGKSHNRWYDPATKSTADKQEYYIDNTEVLWPRPGTSSTGDPLPMGTYRLPFSFLIPENAPCSFEGKVGWLRYALYAKLDMPHHTDKEQKAFLTVLPKADLNTDPRAKITPLLDVREQIGIVNSKPILIRALCDKGGYVPGETISIDVSIENQSNKDISFIRVALEQKAKFYASVFACNKRYVSKTNAAKVKETRLIKGQSQERCLLKLVVPSLPPSDLPGCSIIDLQFRLQFKIKCGTFSSITFKLPLVIGTIPLAIDGNYVSDNPPSYMASVFGSVDGQENDNEEIMGGNQYAPLYSYYSMK